MNIEAYMKYFKPSEEYYKNKVNSHICKACGGDCCNSMGCHIAPDDLMSLNISDIILFIDESGCISIDWWEGNPITEEYTNKRAYFLRIRNKGANVIDPSWGGKCCLLEKSGCKLPFEYRPKGARELIPRIDECEQNYTKQQCVIDWLQYNDLLEQVYNHYADIEGEPDMFSNSIEGLLEMIGRLK